MRETLTYLALAVVSLLALALAAPPFIDWSAYSERLGARLGAALDARVEVKGPLTLQLLPSPRVAVGGLSIERPGLVVRTEETSLELALVPLMRGTVSVASARLERPRLTLDLRASPPASSPLATIGIERVALRDATLTVVTDRSTRQVEHIDLSASADSASGPYKAEGFVRAGGRLWPVRLATGEFSGGRLQIKADVEPLPGLPRVEATGVLISTGEPRFEGSVVLSGQIEGLGRESGAGLPWRVRLDGRAAVDAAAATTVEVRLGRDADRLLATGSGSFSEQAGLQATLQSERPDFDRFLRAFDPVRLARLTATREWRGAFSVDWRADAAILGSEVVTEPRVSLQRGRGDADDAVRVGLSLTTARSGAVAFSGTADRRARVAGDVTLRTDDAPALARWLGTFAGANAPPFFIPFDRVDLAARVETSSGGLDVSGLRAVLDRSSLSGHAAFTAAGADRAARIEATLTSDALDIDALPDFTAARTAVRGLDLSIALEARAIRVARLGRATAEAGRIGLSLTRTGDTLAIDRLALENIGGATLRASARLTPSTAAGTARLEAGQLAELARLVGRVAPGRISDLLSARAAGLSPASLDIAVEAAGAPGGAFVPSRLTLWGRAGDTSVRATVAPIAAGSDAFTGSVSLEAPETAPLLRQLGIPAIPIRGQGSAKVEARLSGRSDGALTVDATATLARSDASFAGTADIGGRVASAMGAVRVNTRDLGPLLRLFATPVDASAEWPVAASAKVSVGPTRVAVSDLDARISGTTLSGSLSKDTAAPIAGSLRIGRLNVGALASVLLGVSQPARDRPFSILRFSGQPNDPPAGVVDVTTDRLDLLGPLFASEAKAKLVFGPGVVEAREARMTVAGGRVSGAAALRRQGDTASVTTSLDLQDVSAATSWGAARIGGRVELAGAGGSAAGLVGSLGGKGVLRVAGATLQRADPDAPARVAAAVDREEIDLDPGKIMAALSRGLDAGPQTLPPFETVLTIDSGQLAAAPADLAVGTGRAVLAGRFDLNTGRVELRETLNPRPPEDWTGPTPALGVTLAGPLDTPVRTVEAAALIGTLAAHGLAREEVRIAAIDADRRERAFFNRRLRNDRAMEAERRAEEARAEAARQEALRLEQEAQRREDEARRREEDARRQREREAEAARLELLRRDFLRQREAERISRERQTIERLPAVPPPLDLRPAIQRRPLGDVPSIIAPDPNASGRF